MNCFPRDLSPWISPRLLSLALPLWQLLQKEGQTFSSHKSEGPLTAFLALSRNYSEQKSGSESLRAWRPLLTLPPRCSEALTPQGAVLLLPDSPEGKEMHSRSPVLFHTSSLNSH